MYRAQPSKIRIYHTPNIAVAEKIVKEICDGYELECDFREGEYVLLEAKMYFKPWLDNTLPGVLQESYITWEDLNAYVSRLLGEDKYLLLFTDNIPAHYSAVVVDREALGIIGDFVQMVDPLEQYP